MLRRFVPPAAAFALIVALALPLPLAADEDTQSPKIPAVTPTEEPLDPTEPAPEIAPVPKPAPAVPPAPPAAAVKPAPKPAASAPAEPEPEPEPKDAPVAVAAASGSVSIKDFSFAPGSVTVNVGDTVTWTNTGDEAHTATGSGFDTGLLSKGQSGSHTFGKAGSFSYICTPHPFMKGTVVVRAASGGGGGGGGSGGSTPGSLSSQGSPGATDAGDTDGGSGETLPDSGADALPLALTGLSFLVIGLFSRRRLESRS